MLILSLFWLTHCEFVSACECVFVCLFRAARQSLHHCGADTAGETTTGPTTPHSLKELSS